MFDQISESYDRTNRILSLGNDLRWRKKMANLLPTDKELSILDLATGTADQIITFCKFSSHIDKIIGIDPSSQMLAIGRKKLATKPYVDKTQLLEGSALQIPFPDKTFDVVSVSFGVRNFSDPKAGLQEMYRVLQENGKVLILEFSLPAHSWIRYLSLFYLKRLIPWIGKMVTANRVAYEYLSNTIQTFPHGKEFIAMMEDCGFRNTSQKKLSFGMVSIYSGEK